MEPCVVVGANRRELKVVVTLPFDMNGDDAFDENGKPIRGRKPAQIVLPRMDTIPAPVLREIMQAVTEIQRDESEMLDAERSARMFMVQVDRYVPDEKLRALLAARPLVELEQISQFWQDKSAIPLGEFMASNGSAMSTRRPSSTTSSPARGSDSPTSAPSV